jgi:phosphohistidine phosphatase
MQLLVIRHAIAEDAEDFARSGKSDELRPLTNDGRERMRAGVRGLRRVCPGVDVLGSSPLLRARQTAEIVAVEFGIRDIAEVDALRPGSKRADLLAWLRDHDAGTVAIVGHNPDLSELTGWLVTGEPRSIVNLKKGAAVLLDFADNRPRAGGATLSWALTPAQMRLLTGG